MSSLAAITSGWEKEVDGRINGAVPAGPGRGSNRADGRGLVLVAAQAKGRSWWMATPSCAWQDLESNKAAASGYAAAARPSSASLSTVFQFRAVFVTPIH